MSDSPKPECSGQLDPREGTWECADCEATSERECPLQSSLLSVRTSQNTPLPPLEVNEPLRWESTTPVFIKYVSDRRYRMFSPKVQAWYRPLCSVCGPSGDQGNENKG